MSNFFMKTKKYIVVTILESLIFSFSLLYNPYVNNSPMCWHSVYRRECMLSVLVLHGRYCACVSNASRCKRKSSKYVFGRLTYRICRILTDRTVVIKKFTISSNIIKTFYSSTPFRLYKRLRLSPCWIREKLLNYWNVWWILTLNHENGI